MESEFIFPTLLGDQIVPFNVRAVDEFVIPLTSRGNILGAESSALDAYPGLAAWVRTADTLWRQHSSSKLSLSAQIDHMRKLTHQVPAAPIRVAYAASGMYVSAALVTDPRAIIEHSLYWAAVSSLAEGHYLVGILNAPTLTEQVRPLMSYGKDERHVDKAVWKLPIPAYDPDNPVHLEIANVAREITDQVELLTFHTDYYVTIRQRIRRWLDGTTSGQRLDQLVVELLDSSTP